jgi:hypothetical protein
LKNLAITFEQRALLSPGDLMTKDLPQPNPACSAWSHKFVFEFQHKFVFEFQHSPINTSFH